MKHPSYSPSTRERWFWQTQGAKRGIYVMCRGFAWGEKSHLSSQAKKLREQGIAAFVRKVQFPTQVRHLLFVEMELNADQRRILLSVTAQEKQPKAEYVVSYGKWGGGNNMEYSCQAENGKDARRQFWAWIGNEEEPYSHIIYEVRAPNFEP